MQNKFRRSLTLAQGRQGCRRQAPGFWYLGCGVGKSMLLPLKSLFRLELAQVLSIAERRRCQGLDSGLSPSPEPLSRTSRTPALCPARASRDFWSQWDRKYGLGPMKKVRSPLRLFEWGAPGASSKHLSEVPTAARALNKQLATLDQPFASTLSRRHNLGKCWLPRMRLQVRHIETQNEVHR